MTMLVFLCCCKRLCILGPHDAIEMCYYYYYTNTSVELIERQTGGQKSHINSGVRVLTRNRIRRRTKRNIQYL